MKLFFQKGLLSLCIAVALLGIVASKVFAGNPPDASFSTLVGSEVPANGTSQSTITITLHDSSDVSLSGDTVSLSAPSDPTIVFSPSSTTLDASGVATFSATSTQPGTDAITVTDTTTSTTLVGLGSVIFDEVPPAAAVDHNQSSTPACGDVTPTAAPDLYQITVDKSTATLYFAPPNTQFTGFNISYGLTSDANSYSVKFNQLSTGGAIKYTINDLYPKTNYYFKVQAVNGCAFGPWSGVKSSMNPSSLKSLPATGPADLMVIGSIIGTLSILAGIGLMFNPLKSQ